MLVSQTLLIMLADGDSYIKRADIVDKYGMKAIRITVGQPLKHGEMVLERFIPIPLGKENEALAHCLALNISAF